MIKSILVPTDFSTASYHALEYSINLAEKYDAEIKIAYVILSDTNMGSFYILKGTLDHFMDQIEGIASENIDKFISKYQGRNIKKIILRGIPHVELADYANNGDTDMVVMGTYKKTPVEYLLYGSTTEKLISKIKKPILVLKL